MPIKVAHYTQFNGSGMNNMAVSISAAEKALGIDSVVLNVFDEKDWSKVLDADVHVAHTHFPDKYNGKDFSRQLTKPRKLVTVFHGTPEHVFRESFEASKWGGYGHGDALQLYFYWLKNADARVTFWPRHAAILKSLVDKQTIIDCLPLGTDYEFWTKGQTRGKYAGNPSVWSGENPHWIKWPFDLVTAWPWVYPELDGACLHLNYMPQNMHRQFAPWMYMNGASYGMHWSANTWIPTSLRDILKSIDFFIGLVMKGDYNCMSMQANCAGTKTISYPGNEYSDFWVPEGDQREIAKQLVRILKGEVEPRAKTLPPDISETAEGMVRIYERILDYPKHTISMAQPFGLSTAPIVTLQPIEREIELPVAAEV